MHFSEGAFIANAGAALRYVEPLPTVFNQTITINESSPLTLSEVAERITRTTAVPVRMLPEVTISTPLVSESVPSSAGLPPPPAGIPNLSLPSPTSSSSAGSSYVLPGLSPMRLSYSGGLSGLLDLIASKNNVSWRYQNGAVEIYKYVTKTLKVHALPGSSELSASVERGGTGTTTGSSGQPAGLGTAMTTTATGSTDGNTTTQTTTINATALSAWKDLENSIKTMLGPDGKVVISQATGTVTITDTPQTVGQIENFIDETNRIMTKQVVVHYRVLTVDHNDSARLGINWTAVFNAMNKNYGVQLSSMALPQAAVGSAILQALIPNTATGEMAQFAGSQILIDALETQGRVSRVTSGALTTLNNQPAPVQVVNEKAYLASVQSLQTANVGSSTALTPGKVVTGFSMNLMPHILDDDRVLMQYSINLSTLRGIFSVTSDSSTIQTPEVDTRTFMQKVSMRAGETLVLSGFERTGLTLDKTGSFAKGGGQETSEDKATVVILITPILTDG
ncbi:PilN family type IVB pilus formation outer membrane protein (plasmid) [Methylocaldum gracile subsp. desertum]|uniref:PilN family type IVB pilus formation outer membrane protein n=1 Tax=Methylocaldum sp. GT1BW TaxID=3438964 RepID=UPI003DA0EB6A